MGDLTISAAFTESVGAPATGLVLAEIDLYLTAVTRAAGVETVVWNGSQHPTEEIDDMGHYIRIYTGADLDTNNYHARATYTGVTVLDTDNITGIVGLVDLPIGTAVEWPYKIENSITLVPIEGVQTWWYANINETGLRWYGVTDTLGWARDTYGRHPRLDPGTYYIFRQLAGYSFTDPDTEVVS